MLHTHDGRKRTPVRSPRHGSSVPPDRLAGLGGRIEIAASWELRRACANAGLTATWAMCPRPTTPYRIVRRIALTWCRPFRMPRKPGALAPDRTESQEPL